MCGYGCQVAQGPDVKHISWTHLWSVCSAVTHLRRRQEEAEQRWPSCSVWFIQYVKKLTSCKLTFLFNMLPLSTGHILYSLSSKGCFPFPGSFIAEFWDEPRRYIFRSRVNKNIIKSLQTYYTNFCYWNTWVHNINMHLINTAANYPIK